MSEADPVSNGLWPEFINSNAIINGHFVLSSGLHSDTYVQCAKVLEDPMRAMRVCAELAKIVRAEFSDIDLVVSPAIGGIIVGYELARQLRVNSIFCERVNSTFTIRRGFEITKNARVLIVEDVVTTGQSSLETATCVKQCGGIVIGEAALVKRSSDISLPFPLVSLINLELKVYQPKDLPENLKNIPITKPGSRHYLNQ